MALAVRCGAGEIAQGPDREPDSHDHPRHRRSSSSSTSSTRRSSSTTSCPARISTRRRPLHSGRTSAAVLLDLLHADRHPRRAHGRRHRADGGHPGDGAGAASSRRPTTRRSKSRVCTGTSSTSSGSSCFRCCICWACTAARTGAKAVMSTAHIITPVRTYVTIFVALLVLTAADVLVATQDFGLMNTADRPRRSPCSRRAGRHLLHGRALQHATDEGRGRRPASSGCSSCSA